MARKFFVGGERPCLAHLHAAHRAELAGRRDRD